MKYALSALICMAVSAVRLRAQTEGTAGAAQIAGEKPVISGQAWLGGRQVKYSYYPPYKRTFFQQPAEAEPAPYPVFAAPARTVNPPEGGVRPATAAVPSGGPAAAAVSGKKKAGLLEAARKKLGLDKIIGRFKKLVERRKSRVSRLQEPGEAMGGGQENRLKEEADKKKAQSDLDRKRAKTGGKSVPAARPPEGSR